VLRGLAGIIASSVGGGWSLSNMSYDSKSALVSGQLTDPQSVFFGDEGTKMYVLTNAGDTGYQYTLSTAWDVSSAAYASKLKDFSGEEVVPVAFVISDDGVTLFLCGLQSGSNLWQYTLSTAWDLSSAGYDSVTEALSEDGAVRDIHVRADGKKLYAMGNTNETVYQYSLGTAWTLSSISYDSKSKLVTPQMGNPQSLALDPTGTTMFVLDGDTNNDVYQYTLTTAWDVSSAGYDSITKDTDAQDTASADIFVKTDGTKLYLAGQTNERVFQYSL
jgi:hypothetical protein